MIHSIEWWYIIIYYILIGFIFYFWIKQWRDIYDEQMWYGRKAPSFLEYYFGEAWENASNWDKIMCYVTWFVLIWNTIRVIYTIIFSIKA